LFSLCLSVKPSDKQQPCQSPAAVRCVLHSLKMRGAARTGRGCAGHAGCKSRCKSCSPRCTLFSKDFAVGKRPDFSYARMRLAPAWGTCDWSYPASAHIPGATSHIKERLMADNQSNQQQQDQRQGQQSQDAGQQKPQADNNAGQQQSQRDKREGGANQSSQDEQADDGE
jgi:hypothetical protein